MDVQHLLATATLTVIIVGLLGNLLSLSLFLRTSSSVNVLLSALAFVDFFLLSFSIPVFVIPNLDIWSDDPDGTNLSSYLAYILKFVYPTNLIFQTSSIYTMVVITIERWFVVNHPLKVSIWCTARTSRRAICCIFLFSMLYNVPRFFEYSMIYSKDGVVEYQRNLRDNSTYMIWYFTASYLLTHFVVPFGLILVLNCHVISAIVKMRKQRQSLTRQQIREQSTTVMLLVVIFIFAICNTLPFLLNLIECIKPNLFSDEDTAQLAFQLNDLSTLLVVFNSSSTWLVYIIFSKKYRQTAVRILWRFCLVEKENVRYSSFSRTYSARPTASINRKNNLSNNAVMDKSMPKRTDRSVSEFNERIQRPASAMVSPNKHSIKSVVSYRSAKNSHVVPPTVTDVLLSPLNTSQTNQWSDSVDRPLLSS